MKACQQAGVKRSPPLRHLLSVWPALRIAAVQAPLLLGTLLHAVVVVRLQQLLLLLLLLWLTSLHAACLPMPSQQTVARGEPHCLLQKLRSRCVLLPSHGLTAALQQ